MVDRHPAPESWPLGLAPGAVDLACAAADGAGLFAKTITLARPHGGRRATLQLSDYPYPIVLARHPDLKQETQGTPEGTIA